MNTVPDIDTSREEPVAERSAQRGEAFLYLCSMLLNGDQSAGCWEWPFSRNWAGYGEIGFGGSGPMRLPRVVYRIVHGEWPELCLHTCDNPPCFNPSHLRSGTQTENMADRRSRGRYGNTPQKMTEEDVHEFRRLVAAGWTNKELGERFGISQVSVFRIKSGRSWSKLRTPGLGASLLVLVVATLGLGIQAGAQDWAPAQDPYIDLLRDPYVPEPGHGPSLHATCAPNGEGVEIGVHPFDEVPRNFQVWDTSPPAPMRLANVTEADWSAVYPFGWLAVLYSGTARYDLVSPDQQRALCLADTSSSTTPESSTTTPPVASSAPSTTAPPPPSTTAPVTPPSEPAPPTGEVTTTTSPGEAGNIPGVDTGVLTSSQQRQTLADTGATSSRLVRWGLTLTALGLLIAIPTGRRLRRAADEQTTPTQDQRS